MSYLSPVTRQQIMKRRAAWVEFHPPNHPPPTETGQELYRQANELLRLAYDPQIEKRRGKYSEYRRMLNDALLREEWLSKLFAYHRRVHERLAAWKSKLEKSE